VAKSGKPAANSEAAAPSVCAALVLSQTTYRAYWNQRGMLASPSVNMTLSIFWCRTSVAIRRTARSTTFNTTKASLPGNGLKDIGRTFDHLSSAFAKVLQTRPDLRRIQNSTAHGSLEDRSQIVCNGGSRGGPCSSDARHSNDIRRARFCNRLAD
jgi:hypothetical protein